MAITVNSNPGSIAQPSAPQVLRVLNVDLDASYPTGGYDIAPSLLGGTIIWSETVAVLDTVLKFVKVNRATNKLQVFVDASGAPGAEAAGSSDQSGIVGLEVAVHTQ